MKPPLRKIRVFTLALVIAASMNAGAQTIKSPEQYFGFRMGTDTKLVKWPQILEYFAMLDQASDKLTVQEIGKTTEGNSLIVAFISSPQNIANLDKYKAISQRLAKARDLAPDEVSRLVADGKLISVISCSLHASEIAASQMSMELAYDLVTKDTPQTREILDKQILLLFPSHNPDGNIMVVDWYNRTVGTTYENSPMPWLYQKYAGHDNNRDWFMLNLQETRVISKFYFQEWFPQVLYDLHQMGRGGARLFVPPFLDPLNPNVHPLLWRGNNLIGANMYRELEERGYTGVADAIAYTSWWEGNSLQQPWFHNMVSVLTEAAGVNTASPIFQRREDLTGNRPGLLEYKLARNFTHPWPGGWWRLRDIVNYEYAAAIAFLDTGAKYKENFLRDFYTMNKDGLDRGKSEPPYAFIVPAEQHDPNTAVKMVNILIEQGAEVHQADADFTADNAKYSKGSYVFLLAQPFRPFIKDIMEPQVYPDMRWFPGGPPIPPYDVAGWTLPMQMGVRSVPVGSTFEAKLTPIKKAELPQPKTPTGAAPAYAIGHEMNDSLTAVNRLLKGGYDVYWSDKPVMAGGQQLPAGTMIVPAKAGLQAQLATMAKELAVPAVPASVSIPGSAFKLKPLRLALYSPWGGNADEGWTKWLLEKFEFPFTEVRNGEIRAGDLNARFDVILLADQNLASLTNGIAEGAIPPEYAGGIGSEGVTNLRAFVEQGGTLVTLGAAAQLPIRAFGLPVRDILEGVPDTSFFCPGSILGLSVDTDHPVGYGMPPTTSAFFARSAAYEILPSFGAGEVKAVARYSERDVLKSGWILGESQLRNKAAVVDAPLGKGRVILFGFRVQNRAQPHATFKLLFNALYYGPASAAKAASNRKVAE